MSAPPIGVKVVVVRLQLNGLGEVGDRLVVLAFFGSSGGSARRA